MLSGASFGSALTSGLLGALSGAAAGAIGGYFKGTGDLLHELCRAMAHGVSQGAVGALQGQDFGGAFAAGFAGSFALHMGPQPKSYLANLIKAAVIGGAASEIGGGKFENGAVSGAFTFIFNKALNDEKGAGENGGEAQTSNDNASSGGEVVAAAGAADGLILLTTEEAAELRASGTFRLDAKRVRSLKYYGNQYDPAEVVALAKKGNLFLARINYIAGKAGYVFTMVSVASDVYQVNNDDISTGRFLYRSVGNAAVISLSVAGSGGLAALVGIGFYGAEKAWGYAILPMINRVAEETVRYELWYKNRALRVGILILI